MKIRRTELVEKGGLFECTVAVDAGSLPEFLALLPVAGRVLELPLGRPPTTDFHEETSEKYVLPPPAPADDRTQVIAPPGFDLTRISGGRALPRELMIVLMLIRDPVFQDWTVRESGVAQTAVPDAVAHAAEYVAQAAGAANVFEIPPEKYPLVQALQARYQGYLDARAVASTGPAA